MKTTGPTVLILAGGKGSRLWPLSRTYYPKPFIHVDGSGQSLFQQTLDRALRITDPEHVFLAINKNHLALAKRQTQKMGVAIPEENILTEPIPRDTLPAITYALRKMDGDPRVVLMPADHYIKEADVLTSAVRTAEKYADKYVVAIGVRPTSPDTGYGYLKPGKKIGKDVYELEEFREKPDAATARRYIREGYLWNTFIHVFRKSLMLAEIMKFAQDTYLTFEKYGDDVQRAYSVVSPMSLSSSVLEKSQKNAVVPVSMTWSDVGSFDRIYRLAEKDADGNASNTHTVALDSSSNYIHAPKGKTVALIGVKGLAVVDSGDALLITRLDRAQDVKHVVKILQEKGGPTDYHKIIPEEWGELLHAYEDQRSKIFKIRVLPGRSAKITVESEAILLCIAGSVRVNGSPIPPAKAIRISGNVQIENTGDEVAEIFKITSADKTPSRQSNKIIGE